MLVYFAAPLFSIAERRFNENLTNKLENIGFDVYLPQRDGAENDKNWTEELTLEDRRLLVFQKDEEKILECDVFLFILDGRVPDEGASVELGIAYCQKKILQTKRLILGLQTDSRAAFLHSKLNPMINVPLEYVTEDEDSLLRILENYKRSGSVE